MGDRDLFNPNVMRDNMHDWVLANENMATRPCGQGIPLSVHLFARNAGHVDQAVKQQTLGEARLSMLCGICGLGWEEVNGR